MSKPPTPALALLIWQDSALSDGSVVNSGVIQSLIEIAVLRASSSFQHDRRCLFRSEAGDDFCLAETHAAHIKEDDIVPIDTEQSFFYCAREALRRT